MIDGGHESYIAFGQGDRPSESELIKVGNRWDIILHGILTRLFDLHGFGSKSPTKRLIEQIENIKPNMIGLLNLHGYYINVEILFKYLKQKNTPVIWTLFDCWAFTGHCSYFEDINCLKWQSACHTCPKKNRYPASYGLDNSANNFNRKLNLFTGLENLTIIVHSNWLYNLVKSSILKEYPVHIIRSGVDLDIFQPKLSAILNTNENKSKKKIILGCANIWNRRKGLTDFIMLRHKLSVEYQIVLIGVSQKQINKLPTGIIGIERTENLEQLAELYSSALVFVNPTYLDNFPTTNLEALACGTPVITYNTGGSPESIDDSTGRVVSKGDIDGLVAAIYQLAVQDIDSLRQKCRQRAEMLYDKNDRFSDYVELYTRMLTK